MTLLKNWSSIITFTGGAVLMFLMQRIKYSTIYETLKEKINNWKKNNYAIPELPNPNWVKIGKIEDLHIHPLASGDRVKCSKLKFTPHGAITKQNGLILRDKMFHIYDEKTKQFQNTHHRTVIHLLRANMLSKSHVEFSVTDFKITIDLEKETIHNCKILKELKSSWIEIKYIDCGEEVAKWLNSTLCTSNLRIVRAEYNIIDEPIMEKDTMKENADDEAWEIFLNLTGYTVITIDSMLEFIYNTQQFFKNQPHIIVSAPSYPVFAETNWEWIRINNIIMKRIMPVSNLTSVQESFKKEDPYHHPPKFLGIFYGLFTAGDANVNDDVYIHIP